MIKSKNGMIIIFVVVILGMISILYSSIYILIGIENRIYTSLESRTKAYYLAESGAEQAMSLINQNSDTESFPSNRPVFPEYKNDNWYTVDINLTPPNIYTIISTGHYDKAKRIVEVVATKDLDGMNIESWKETN